MARTATDQMSAPSSIQSARTKRICPKPLDQLMIHHTDTVVKPIIGNKDIEMPEEVVYKK